MFENGFIAVCGRAASTVQQGFICSLNYPRNYVISTDCSCTVSFTTPSTVSIVFNTTFWLETSFDYVEVMHTDFFGKFEIILGVYIPGASWGPSPPRKKKKRQKKEKKRKKKKKKERREL